MSIALTERVGSDAFTFGRSRSIIKMYTLTGSTDLEAIETHIKANTPATLQGLLRADVRCEPTEQEGLWLVEVVYSPTVTSASGTERPQPQFAFNITAQPTRISLAYDTVTRAPADAPDFGNQINVTDEGVEGVDVFRASFTESQTRYYTLAEVQDLKEVWFELSGTVNDAPWNGYQRGEVLLTAVRGARRGVADDDLFEITFEFAANKNQANVTLEGISVGSVEGWHYVWARVEATEDTVAKRVIKQVAGVYVQQVYKYGNFGALGLT